LKIIKPYDLIIIKVVYTKEDNMIKNFEEVFQTIKSIGPKKIAVACAQDVDVLKAVDNAKKQGIADAVLIGNQEMIEANAAENEIHLTDYEIIDIDDMKGAALKAVELVFSGKADMVMKGLVDTSIFLKAVLDKEIGLRTGNVLSHVALFDVPSYHKFLVVTDAAMNIEPDLEAKKMIIENSLMVTKALGIAMPKVAALCAKEKVNPKMPATVEADKLQRMNEAGEIKECMVAGPLALDNAISVEAAKLKGIDHPVAGDADVLLAPDIEAGNILYKALGFLAKSKGAGVIVGTTAPVILTSRADDEDTKLNSIALAALMASI
jgi:phosphate butyryltransferase